jgi:copper chaperone
MERITYAVPGVSCAHCQAAIADAVQPLAGVATVDVDVAAKTVTVTGKRLDEEAIVAAIDEAGYEVVT